MEIMAPVSAGELIDKITILEIKAARIGDPAKRANVLHELERLSAIRAAAAFMTPAIEALAGELRAVNEGLWDVEDGKRECERRQDFGPGFVELARRVYRENDRRAAIKRAINEAAGSSIIEEKSYGAY